MAEIDYRKTATSFIWAVIGSLFLLATISQYRGLDSKYGHISTIERPMMKAYPQLNLTIGGMAVDQPLRDFAKSFNDFIDQTNIARESDAHWAIILNIIGMISAYFSAFYELTNKR